MHFSDFQSVGKMRKKIQFPCVKVLNKKPAANEGNIKVKTVCRWKVFLSVIDFFLHALAKVKELMNNTST